MCVVHQKLVNKLDLTWKQSFLIHGIVIVGSFGPFHNSLILLGARLGGYACTRAETSPDAMNTNVCFVR
jgi:hypothetical protein